MNRPIVLLALAAIALSAALAAASPAGADGYCKAGDRLVASGDQAYCVSQAANKPYPAGR